MCKVWHSTWVQPIPCHRTDHNEQHSPLGLVTAMAQAGSVLVVLVA